MVGYLYKGSALIVGPVDVESYTGTDISTTTGGRFTDLVEGVELSSKPDLSEHLLEDYREAHKQKDAWDEMAEAYQRGVQNA